MDWKTGYNQLFNLIMENQTDTKEYVQLLTILSHDNWNKMNKQKQEEIISLGRKLYDNYNKQKFGY